jgi:hypothetical protein
VSVVDGVTVTLPVGEVELEAVMDLEAEAVSGAGV